MNHIAHYPKKRLPRQQRVPHKGLVPLPQLPCLEVRWYRSSRGSGVNPSVYTSALSQKGEWIKIK